MLFWNTAHEQNVLSSDKYLMNVISSAITQCLLWAGKVWLVDRALGCNKNWFRVAAHQPVNPVHTTDACCCFGFFIYRNIICILENWSQTESPVYF